MKSLFQFALIVLFFCAVHFTAHAAYSSFFVFGDGLSCTTTNPQAGPIYYGKRFSNGRVWVEVLAQRQGLAFDPASNTNSFFGNTSSNLLAEINNFTPPTDASNALMVIWVNNADLYYPAADPSPTLAKFTSAINFAQTNHFKAITNLYAKGIRTLIMPDVVDISAIPAFNTYTTQTNLFHQASINFNAAFYATLDKARTNCPGLTIFVPGFYALLSNLLTHSSNYGVTNVLVGGLSMDAVDAFNYGFPVANTNGYGTNYIFWDPTNPTAMVHSIMASTAQQLISPVQIGKVISFVGSNRLDVVNMPIGLDGFVDGLTNLALANWTSAQGFSSTNTTQSIFVPTSGPQQFYRLRFPYAWQWP